MTKQLSLFVVLMVSLRMFAIDTEIPELHWSLPTTLEGIRQESAKLKDIGEPIPASIMCQNIYGGLSVRDEALGTDQPERYWTVKRDMTLASVPYLTLGIALHAIKRDVRKINNDINEGFHNRIDDYMQFSPLLLTYGLKAFGYEGRSKWGRLLASNALSAAIMAGIVNAIKYSAAELRPDGSTSNSFPSGHTATAFMAATILHKEYGLTRSLWYSVGGYAVATGIATFRVMNNRHWISDVMAGAGIGILSTELGYALGDLIFKDKHTLRREKENLNDLTEHSSFFSLQAGVGIEMGDKNFPFDIFAAGGPNRLKYGVSSVISTEAAYFLNPYIGFGVRSRIISTAVTPQWDGINGFGDIWNSGNLHYDPATDQYQHPNVFDPTYKFGNTTHKDQLSSYDIMGGIYGQWPLNKRMNLGGKLLFGHRQSGDIWFWADKSGCNDDNEYFARDFLEEMTKGKQDINTYDHIQVVDMEGKGSFIFGTGIYFSYALKQNIVWRIGLDYDFTRANYDYLYANFSLVDIANDMLKNPGKEYSDEITGTFGSSRHARHQLTPSFGICFSF